MPWKSFIPAKRPSSVAVEEDIGPVIAGPEYGTSSKVAGKSLESGLREGRADDHHTLPETEKTIEHLEKVEHREDVDVNLNRRQKLKRHCGRRWKWYLLGTVIFLAIMLPVFFMVIFPAIVQRMIDDADLPIHEGSIRAVDADTVELSVVVGLSVPGPFTVQLDPTTLFFYNKDAAQYSPWTSVSLGGQSVSGDSNITVDKYMADIADPLEFGIFLDDLFANPTAIMSGTADATVRLGALKADIDLTKHINVNGLDRLRGFGFESLRVILPPEEDGTNIRGVLNLPNHSDIRLQLGNVTFNALMGDLVVGKVETWDTDVSPGNNSVVFLGEIYIQTIMENIGTVLRSQTAALAEGQLALATTGNQTTVDGVRIPYVEKVLAPRIETRVPLIQALGDLLSGFLDSPVLEDPLEILEDLFENLDEGLNRNGTDDDEESIFGGLNDEEDDDESIFGDLNDTELVGLLGVRGPEVKNLLRRGHKILQKEAPNLLGKRTLTRAMASRSEDFVAIMSLTRRVLEKGDWVTKE